MRRAILILVLLGACGKKQGAIAELTRAEGAVERQPRGAGWRAAAVGTRFYLGDAAQTADNPAELAIVGGNAHIAMRAHTILQFGGAAGAAKIAVESGGIDLSGTGSYALDVGDVRLSRNGTIRVSSTGPGQSSVELTVGEAQISTVGGDTLDLEIGRVVDLGDVKVTTLVDAGVQDAAAIAFADAAQDAGIDPVPVATLEITGKRGEIQLAGEIGGCRSPQDRASWRRARSSGSARARPRSSRRAARPSSSLGVRVSRSATSSRSRSRPARPR
ncbi:MAG: hypothetical protein WKG01_14180 [Kofleriaceae bacterium]